jgi:hypothetical protein
MPANLDRLEQELEDAQSLFTNAMCCDELIDWTADNLGAKIGALLVALQTPGCLTCATERSRAEAMLSRAQLARQTILDTYEQMH